MDIFLDTANTDEINEILQWGIIKGVTTNQKIFLKENRGVFSSHQNRRKSIEGNKTKTKAIAG